MKTIEIKGWTFTFKPLTTKTFNQSIPLCDCPSCRNFRMMVKECYPELRDFLNQFEVEVNKSDEVVWWVRNPSEKTINYIAYYSVVGFASSDDKNPIEIGPLNIFVQQPSLDENDESYFVFEVKDIILTWNPKIDCENVFAIYPQKHSSWQAIKGWTKCLSKKIN